MTSSLKQSIGAVLFLVVITVITIMGRSDNPEPMNTTPAAPAIEVMWEDGSYRLTDGTMGCTPNAPCDDNAPVKAKCTTDADCRSKYGKGEE